MHTIYLTLSVISLFATGSLLCSCGGRQSVSVTDSLIVNPDSLPENVTDIVAAVAKSDSAKFSSHVNYPLERPYPLKDIEDEEQMKSYYSVMVDDSLKKVISKSSTGDWSEAGWRGWTVKDGQYLWIDENVYEVNYLSAKERLLKDSLVKKEKASLAGNLGKGWVPEWVMEDPVEGTLYRIDADSTAMVAAHDGLRDGEFRLSVYVKGGDLHRHPDKVLKGKRKVEGTIGSVNYFFDAGTLKESPDSAEYVIELYSENGKPRLYHREKRESKFSKIKKGERLKDSGSRQDTVIDHELKKVYWLDKMNLEKKDTTSKKNKN